MSIIDTVVQKLADRITLRMQQDPRVQGMEVQRTYRLGVHRRALKPSRDGHNDNVALNFCGLVINRAVSQTIGKGIELKFEGDDAETESPNHEYVSAALDANKQEVLFHRSLLFSCESGTGYWMLYPEGTADTNGQVFTRVVVCDPMFMSIKTKFGDMEIVESYTQEYQEADPVTGKEIGRRKVVARDMSVVDERWTITDYVDDGQGWKPVGPPVAWPWNFSPVMHWQNSPSTDSVYGEPDITDDLIQLQDQINFDASNMNKILRLWAHPQLVLKGIVNKLNIGPDQALNLPQDGDATLLSPVGDIPGASNYLLMLKKTFFDVARMVDIDTLDAQGALTNFGMRVRYQDNLNKINTKRELFGDAIEELCRRLQIMGGLVPVEVEVEWPEWMPVNEAEEMQAAQMRLEMGLESRQSIAESLGLDWEQEQERIDGEKQASDNIGAVLLRMANRGQENGTMPNIPPNQSPPLE